MVKNGLKTWGGHFTESKYKWTMNKKEIFLTSLVTGKTQSNIWKHYFKLIIATKIEMS